MIVLGYYIIICVLSFICTVIYYLKKRSYYSVRYTLVFVLALLSQFCYLLLALSENVREALVINKFLYIGGCFFPLIGLFLVFSICKIHLPKWAQLIFTGYAAIVYTGVLTAGYLPYFYKTVEIEKRAGVTVLVKEYGPFHSLFLIEIILFLFVTIYVLAYGWIKKPNVSRRNLVIMAFMQMFSIFTYFLGRRVTNSIEWMALTDLVDEIGFLIIMDRMGLYSVDDMVSSSLLKDGKFAYISLDLKRRYLSATEAARKIFPKLNSNHADHIIQSDEVRELFDSWIDEYEKDHVSKNHTYRKGELIYTVRISDLYDGTKKRGYLFELTDDTAHHQHMEGIERYNKNLNAELKAKTELIRKLREGKS